MKSKILSILFLLAFCFTIDFAIAQPPPPPGHGSTANQTPPGGGAPIAGGIGILLAMGVVYGTRKFYISKKEE